MTYYPAESGQSGTALEIHDRVPSEKQRLYYHFFYYTPVACKPNLHLNRGKACP